MAWQEEACYVFVMTRCEVWRHMNDKLLVIWHGNKWCNIKSSFLHRISSFCFFIIFTYFQVFQDQIRSNDGTVQTFAESILWFFSGFEAFHLPPPSSDLKVLKNMAKNKRKLNTAFRNGVKKFKDLLQSVLKAKHSFDDGDIVTGEGEFEIPCK